MKVLFAGGGTGGHVTPALAIFEAMKKEYKNADAAFVGRSGGDENRAITGAGYKLYTLDVMGFRRAVSLKNAEAAFKLIRAMRDAKRILSDFSPDVVIGTGGYVCYPVLVQAARRGIPTFIHESNAYPGLVTRLLARKCTCVMLGSEACEARLPKKARSVYVGNPVRESYCALSRTGIRKQLGIRANEILIVSFGGSGGAKKINDAVVQMMKRYCMLEPKIKHIHASGTRYYEELERGDPELCCGTRGCRIVPYIENMPQLLTAADISITRSGAMTLAEISATQSTPIMIPSPNVTDDHQYHNAKAFCDKGYGVVIKEEELSPEKLIGEVSELVRNARKRRCGSDIKEFAHPSRAARRILDTISGFVQ